LSNLFCHLYRSIYQNPFKYVRWSNLSAGSGVSVATDYTNEMSSNTFRTFSEVWENDAGYSRTDLGCVPGETYFNYNVTMPCTYDPVLPPGGFCPIYGCKYY
jgi:hypothetical protein